MPFALICSRPGASFMPTCGDSVERCPSATAVAAIAWDLATANDGLAAKTPLINAESAGSSKPVHQSAVGHAASPVGHAVVACATGSRFADGRSIFGTDAHAASRAMDASSTQRLNTVVIREHRPD